jgi:hypothetical protein
MKQENKQEDVSNTLEGFQNGTRLRDETRSKNSPKKLATPERNSQPGPNCPNAKDSENSFALVIARIRRPEA